ncbi:MAG TPA: Zn-ribbon domain-containing OB-fold protein [Dehalococcoidia bacterium]|nr:Zn-ribbon domain-containing OB-fold protein [Dehalococcoidia bacterium]
MTQTTQTTPGRRIVPRPSLFSRPFWQAARRHELVFQHCNKCGHNILYPRYNCIHCGSTDLGWRKASGKGTVYSFTVARRPTHPAFVEMTPFVIAIVDLEEGVRMTSNIIGCKPEEVRVGMPVEATFEDVNEEVALVMFRPASS